MSTLFFEFFYKFEKIEDISTKKAQRSRLRCAYGEHIEERSTYFRFHFAVKSEAVDVHVYVPEVVRITARNKPHTLRNRVVATVSFEKLGVVYFRTYKSRARAECRRELR